MAIRRHLVLGFFICIFSFVNAQVPIWNQRLISSHSKSWLEFGFISPTIDSSILLSKWKSQHPLSYIDSTGGFIVATPLLNLCVASEVGNDSLRYQNSRGILLLAGGLKLKIHALLQENQAIFATYQRSFIQQHGEFYPTSNGYMQTNGVVPGEGRTKPFKGAGFDYMNTRGGFEWEPTERIKIFGGNQQLLFGYGTRSLFWGDHNQALLIGGQFRISSQWTYISSLGSIYDLIRKPVFEGVESSVYNKGVTFLSFIFNRKIHEVCFVYQNIWNKGSPFKEARLSPLYWIPIPGFSYFQKNNINTPQIGACYKIQVGKSLQMFTELFTRNFQKSTASILIGGNFITHLGTSFRFRSDFCYVHTGDAFYGDGFQSAFTHNNLPLGSVLGNGIDEFQVASQFRFKQFFLNYIFQYYQTRTPKNLLIMPSFNQGGEIFHHFLEAGMMINEPTQLSVFLGLDYRVQSPNVHSLLWYGGIKTALFRPQHVY